MKFRYVFHALVLSYFSHEKGRSLLTLFGVSLGVAVLVAINISNDSAVRSFRQTVDSVAGAATLSVRGNASGIEGSLLPVIARVEGVRGAAPLISGTVAYEIPGSASSMDSLLMLGVDLLFSEEFDEELIRDISFQTEEGRSFSSFLTDPSVAIFTESFARRHELSMGDHVRVVLHGTARDVVVGGLLEGGSLERAQGGNVMVVDLGIADHWLRRGGLLDQVDVVVADNVSTEQMVSRLRDVLSANVLVERPDARSERTEGMLAAFRFNLNALGHISLLVGAFLIYNTMSIAVVRRRTVIGTLRAMGISGGMVRAAFLVEGLLFGIVGGLIGIALGILMAWLMLDAVTAAITINFFDASGSRLFPSFGTMATSFALGVAFSLAAALAPSHEAAKTPPSNTMRRGSLDASESPFSVATLAIGIVAFLAASLLLLREPTRGVPVQGYMISGLYLLAFLLWGRGLLWLVARASKPILAKIAKADGLLAVTSLQSSIGRSTPAVGGLLLGVAMTVSVTVMISSFRTTVTTWMNQVLMADLYIRSASGNGITPGEPISPEVIEAIAALEGIDAVDPFRTRPIIFNGYDALLGAGSFSSVRFGNRSMDGEDAQVMVRRAKENGEVIASEAFARRHRINRGDSISLPTPDGPRSFGVAGVYFDYSNEQGIVVMDRELYREIYGDDLVESIAVYAKADVDIDALRRSVLAAASDVAGAPPLSIQLNTELREFALDAFDRTFGITYVLQLVAILVAVLGVATTLLSQILDRRHEIATLRFIGATRGRVARIILIESSLIAIGGILPGVIAGVLLSWILTKVIMLESFGWTIAFAVPPLVILQIAAVVFVATLLSALLPAREAIQESSRSLVVSG